MSEQEKNVDDLPKHIGFSSKKITLIGVGMAVFLSAMVITVVKYRTKPAQAEKEVGNSAVLSKKVAITPENMIEKINQNKKQRGSLAWQEKRSRNLAQRQVPTARHMELTAQPMPIAEPNMIESDAAKRRREFLKEVASAPITVVNNRKVEVNQQQYSSHSAASEAESFDKSLMNIMKNQPMPGQEYNSQNAQSEKKAFLKKAAKKSNFLLDSTLEKPVSPYEVKAGTIINAMFITGINSDLPGTITASVSRNIYDTVTGNHLLIPQGTKVLGYYDSQIAYGQKRVLMAWSRLIFPNGDSFDLQGQPGVDLAGMSGISDTVDNHTFRVFGSALMFSLFGALGQLSQPKNETNQFPSNGQIIYGAIGQQLTQTGAALVMKNMNIQPTIKIRPGARFNILLTKDMVLPGAYRYRTKEITLWQQPLLMDTK